MRLPIALLLLALATVAACTESPPTDYPPNLARYAFKPPVEDYYPSASRELKEEGSTIIRLCYDEQGRLEPVTVAESSGFERIDEAAVRWGNAVRVTPGVYGGKPQPACLRIPVKFALDKSQQLPAEDEVLLPPFFEPPRIIINPGVPPYPPPQQIPLAPSPPPRPIPL